MKFDCNLYDIDFGLCKTNIQKTTLWREKVDKRAKIPKIQGFNPQ